MLSSDIVRQVSLDLNDQEAGYEYSRWSYAQLLSYLQEAMEFVALSLKELFTDRVVVELQSGSWQTACDCTKILRVLGECTSDGSRILRRLRRMSDDDSYAWTGTTMSCPSPSDLDGYMLSSTDDKAFAVVPPVSGRKSKYVLVECYAKPDVSAEGFDAPSESVMIVKQWMLYRAMAVDSENSPTILQLAQQHQQEFHNLLQLSIQRRMMEEAQRNAGIVRPASDSSSE